MLCECGTAEAFFIPLFLNSQVDTDPVSCTTVPPELQEAQQEAFPQPLEQEQQQLDSPINNGTGNEVGNNGEVYTRRLAAEGKKVRGIHKTFSKCPIITF